MSTNFLTKEYTTISTPNGVHEGVAIRLMPGRTTASIIRGTDILEERADAVNVVDLSASAWLVEFGDGTRWRVENMRKPCNCG
jgi:hypothetical protein